MHRQSFQRDNYKMRSMMIPGLAILIGCQSVADESVPVPAILSNPDHESHIYLTRAVSSALGGAPVTLSPSAFTRSSRLYIDNRPPANGMGTGPDGKKLVPARVFELLVEDGQCFLKTPTETILIEMPRVQCEPVTFD